MCGPMPCAARRVAGRVAPALLALPVHYTAARAGDTAAGDVPDIPSVVLTSDGVHDPVYTRK